MINLITFLPLLSHGEHPMLLGRNAMFLRKTFRREWDRSFQGNEQLGGRPRFHLCWREIRTKKSSSDWLITLRFRFSPAASHRICCWGNENCQTGLIYVGLWSLGIWVTVRRAGGLFLFRLLQGQQTEAEGLEAWRLAQRPGLAKLVSSPLFRIHPQYWSQERPVMSRANDHQMDVTISQSQASVQVTWSV